ncbi:NAD(P)/FAD-dependent oxidoreductase [Pacificibacter marinus]|uniref:Protoporphyrinogen oxidase n=1 Tax=Pacificibacter marinus TaxID=658057 RepID=A0A1Y5SKR3_9RHOB|nr:FAD-dependent oxidoreductase [Pacificibacter marinus]SEK58205.1 Predicted NAD/FAD-binding protein [Pacificibacter marinus]SLN42905.1 protoporphyrinogen oxidase [Pacificibacter marinus]
MSFDIPPRARKRIAIIGSGISGLASAYLMSPEHDVTVFESEPRLGGHARTLMAGKSGDQPVDTGFIVFNYANYPNLTAMFDALNVPVIKSDMSFGATINGGAVEYGLQGLGALFGQKSNIARPAFLRMVRDIFKFNQTAQAHVTDETTTIGALVQDLQLGDWFIQYYLMPICGAIWSTPPSEIRNYPAASLLRFFRNHALLSATGQHQWYTVKGGSIEYIKRLETHLTLMGCTFRLGTPVAAVTRDAFGVTIKTQCGTQDHFDQVVFACHSDQALKLLAKPTLTEHKALSDLRYQANRVTLHSDPSQMPKRRACWSSWVYKSDAVGQEQALGVTYWMNKLQAIDENDPLFVTLNAATPIDEAKIYDETTLYHPVFDNAALNAQQTIQSINGDNRTWFAGAYLRNGFHEDGFHSAVQVAEKMDRVLV